MSGLRGATPGGKTAGVSWQMQQLSPEERMWSHLFAGGVSPEIGQTPRHPRTQHQVTLMESLLCAGHCASPSASASSLRGLLLSFCPQIRRACLFGPWHRDTLLNRTYMVSPSEQHGVRQANTNVPEKGVFRANHKNLGCYFYEGTLFLSESLAGRKKRRGKTVC